MFSSPASTITILTWLLRKAGHAATDKVVYIAMHPTAAARDLWEWMKENKLTCFLIDCGILVLVVPPLLGFSAAGPVAV